MAQFEVGITVTFDGDALLATVSADLLVQALRTFEAAHAQPVVAVEGMLA